MSQPQTSTQLTDSNNVDLVEMNSKEEINSMESVISSLSNSFKRLPLRAIPPLIDCILATTALSPSSLFHSLIHSFPNLINDVNGEEQILDYGSCEHITSMVLALCHLLKKLGSYPDGMLSFIWKCFIPLSKMVCERQILNLIAESFFEVVRATDSWEILEATLVPFYLRSIGLSLGMLQNEEPDVFEWSQHSDFPDCNDLKNNFQFQEKSMSLSASFPLTVSCNILALVLDAALQCLEADSSTSLLFANGKGCVGKISCNLLWDLCNMTERLLSQSTEHRSCSIGFFLPILFREFVSHSSLEVSICGEKHTLSGNLFMIKIWKCCLTLFSHGPSERRDAYTVLSLYLSYFTCQGGGKREDDKIGIEDFDLRSERNFWDEIKKGLIHEEALVRKESLHILKTVLQLRGESEDPFVVSEKKLNEKNSVAHGMTKRELWADKEAKSLGVEKLCNAIDSPLDKQQQWDAFVLLYEMLQEYGTHLVEAAWSHRVTSLLHYAVSHDNFGSLICGGVQPNKVETLQETFSWLAILWQLGFCHENPQVRCLILQSFLGIEWEKYRDCVKFVPKNFVLGPLIDALNDPVHHRDFGVKAVYTSQTIEGAAFFLHKYASHVNYRDGISFLHKLASVAKHLSLGRAGLMSLAECIASAALGLRAHEADSCRDAFCNEVQMNSCGENHLCNDEAALLDVFRFVIESSKQHFNPNYRLRVCNKVLEAAGTVIIAFNVPIESLLHFISAFPREFTDYGGSLRRRTQDWLLGNEVQFQTKCYDTKYQLLTSLQHFPERFTRSEHMVDNQVAFDDEDLDAWELEAKRWARVLFLVIKWDYHLVHILKFIKDFGVNVCKENNFLEWLPVKFAILTMSLVAEIQMMQERAFSCGNRIRSKTEVSMLEKWDSLGYAEASAMYEKVYDALLPILENLLSFADMSSSVFWVSNLKDTTLPGVVKGKLGGRSQRRLSSFTTTVVLQAKVSIQAVASVSSWCAQFKSNAKLNSAWRFLWNFFEKVVSSPACVSETAAEICLSSYEALAAVLQALVSTVSPLVLDLINESHSLMPHAEVKPLLDVVVFSFLLNINNLLEIGVLARTRRAVLLNSKWICLESLLSIPFHAFVNGFHLENGNSFFSAAAIRKIFNDLVESLENAGEGSVLAMLRSVRLVLRLFASGNSGSLISSCSGVDTQSSWILHVGNKKRRVASIAALLSSMLHASVFTDHNMHLSENSRGPIKWFVENVLEEGTKSPHTIRLAALHLTGLWLQYPKTIKFYIKELKLLTLHGSVAFDEDFGAELVDNYDARTEVSLLAKSPDPELTEALSSYVFVAANIILHAPETVQSRHLYELLPAIIPLLTSHHHSLRGFTQLLVYQVLCKFFSPLDDEAFEAMPLEKRSFEDLRLYLEKNPDCKRLRQSMGGYLDAYNPTLSCAPAGIFINRVEELEFECVPTCLMDEVLKFLNNVREDLRYSMAKDVVAIKNESLKIDEDCNNQTLPHAAVLKEKSLDFQKKITPSKQQKENDSCSLLRKSHVYEQLLEMEKEDELLDQAFQSRSSMMESMKASRQQFIVVASLLDRIPNLAGLARTCEVFKASGVAISDASIVRDKQFQLISVTAEKWVPIIEVPVKSVKNFLEKKKRQGFSILGLEQTANSVPLDQFVFPKKTVLVLGREKEGIPVDIIHVLDACIEIPQLGVVRSLNVHSMEQLSSEAKVLIVLMHEEPVFSILHSNSRIEVEGMEYKEKLSTGHDMLLESLFDKDSCTKLYSYTHLLNGFAVHVKSSEVYDTLRNENLVKAIHEDIKMEKLTTHTADFLGISASVWPTLGGAQSSGEGVVIGLIDTGINPYHPSFASISPQFMNSTKYKGKCATGERFPATACNGKIVGAQYFARAAIAAGDFNATRDYASPFDADGHGSHTASTAAGNSQIPVIVKGFKYGSASGMAPGARIAVYKALYAFGGYMSDVVAAVHQAVEDGVDILSLSIGPSSVPPGPSAFLNVLELELLYATRAGVFVVQAAGNGGPSSSSILSFSPWITSAAASITDRKYNNTIILGNGQRFPGTGLAPPTIGQVPFPIAAAVDVSHRNITSVLEIESCQHPEHFIRLLARALDFVYESASIATVADTIQKIGAVGFIMTMDPESGSEQIKGTTMTLQVPAIILNNMEASSGLWEYYNSNTIRSRNGHAVLFSARARILDGRRAFFTGQAPIVASYSSRGPDVNNALLQTADVLKPNIMAPGSSIWAAWSPTCEGDPHIKGVDGDSVRQAVGKGCQTKRRAWCSDLNAASLTISNLVGSRNVIRRVTNVNGYTETYTVTVMPPPGVNVTVSPEVFVIRGHASRQLRINLQASRATRAYTYGEMILNGSRRHRVRVPIAVYVSTSYKS